MKRARPQESIEFDPAEFAAIFEIAVRSGESPQLDDPEKLDVELVGDDGLPVQLSDTPFNRAGMALKRRFPDDEIRFMSALFRFRALMDLITKNALGSWTRSSIRREGSSRIHPAVLDVASRMKPSRNGKFAVNKFLGAVEETARAEYGNLPEWPLDPANPTSESVVTRRDPGD